MHWSLAFDQLNHSAEFYLNYDQAQDLLSHRQLLQDYGAEEDLVDEMLSDQGMDLSEAFSKATSHSVQNFQKFDVVCEFFFSL